MYACRFSAAALYGMREIDMIEGVKPVNPLDILDATLTARREGALVMQTWTVCPSAGAVAPAAGTGAADPRCPPRRFVGRPVEQSGS